MMNFGAAALFLFFTTVLLSICTGLKLGEACFSLDDCDVGLHCASCLDEDNVIPHCTQIQPLNPFSKVKGLPFNRYSWLMTHKSFSSFQKKSGTGTLLITRFHQDDSITSQLNNGVRGLILDMYDFENDIWLCYSFGGKCYNETAFRPAFNALKEIQVFLEANPSEIVTISIEDYVTSPKGLTKVFNAAGLRKFWFPVALMPKDGGEWPTVDEMVKNNQRLIVFTSNSSKESSEGIAYKWKYLVENQHGYNGMKAGSCPNRAESPSMNSTARSLVLMNYYRSTADEFLVCEDNSAPLISMMNTCYEAAGKRWPNFIAVDFYQKSYGGGAPQAVDRANGQSICGCHHISSCKEENMSFGSCDQPEASTASSSKENRLDNLQVHWLIGASLVVAILFSNLLAFHTYSVTKLV